MEKGGTCMMCAKGGIGFTIDDTLLFIYALISASFGNQVPHTLVILSV